MGLIKAAINAVAGNLADQYKEYIYCESLSNDILAAKGHKRVGSRGTNKGDDNVITDGSAIAVNEGQCALVVVDGKVSEVAAEAGVFEFKSSCFSLRVLRKPWRRYYEHHQGYRLPYHLRRSGRP